MAHLFTNHDKYHIHKTLGFLAVANFILRFYFYIALSGGINYGKN